MQRSPTLIVLGALVAGLLALIVACVPGGTPSEATPAGAETPVQGASAGTATAKPSGAAATGSAANPPAATQSEYQTLLPSVTNQSTPGETPGATPVAQAAAPTVQPTATPGPPPPPPATPMPTPTPRPLRETKLGVGVYDGGDRMIQALEEFRPSVILLMDPNPDWAKKIREKFPKAFIVGRVYSKDQPLDNPEARGVEFADRVAEYAVPLKGVVDAWMSYNEVTDRTNKDTYVAYNTFQVAFAKRLQDHYGIPAVAGNDATATVEPEDYPAYFREAIEASAYFGIHLYAPKGVKSFQDPDGRYVMLRYREIKAALDNAGVKSGPFIITEAGLWDGWRDFVSEEQMANDFIWYGDELAKDDYVKGVTIYGLFDWENRNWYGFNIYPTSIVSRIGEYNTEPPS